MDPFTELDACPGATTPRSASTMRGSNCVPAHAQLLDASSCGIAARYERSVRIAFHASQQAMTRDSTGMSSPARPSG